MARHLGPNCGAPRPRGEPGAIERCRFCDAEAREDPPPPPPAPPARPAAPPFVPRFQPASPAAPILDLDPIRPPFSRGPARLVPYIGLLVGIAVALVVVVPALFSAATKKNDSHGTIGTTTLSGDWQAIDVSGTPADTRFDPVAEIGWVRGVATAWKADALLNNLHASEVGSDGIAHLSGGSWVEYFFMSAKWTDCPHRCGLDVVVDAPDGKPRVRVAEYDIKASQQALHVGCSLPDAFASLAKKRRVPAQPTYDARLVDRSPSPFDALAKWELRTPTNETPRVSAMPRPSAPIDVGTVDATSCAVDPSTLAAPDTSTANGGRCVVPLAPVAPGVPSPAGDRCPPEPAGRYKLAHARVSFPDSHATVDVELARSTGETQRGLQYRTALAENAGMLFVMPDRKVQRFWMHDGCIPLDMLFLDDDGLVVGVVESAAVLDDTSLWVDCPSRYVLAVNAGWVRRHGVQPGQRATLPR